MLMSFLGEPGTAFSTKDAEVNSTQIPAYLSHDQTKNQWSVSDRWNDGWACKGSREVQKEESKDYKTELASA